MWPYTRVPESFLDSTMSFVTSLSGARHVVFFWLDPSMMPTNCRMGYKSNEYQEFMRKIAPSGPVSPQILANAGQAVGYLDDNNPSVDKNGMAEYRRYLGSHRFVDEVSLILKCGGDFVAGIAAFRHADEVTGATCAANFSNVAPILEKSIPYIEFNLSRHFGRNLSTIRKEIMDRYSLTAREAEVAELIGAGCTNADIGQCLGLQLATVKTHVIHLFRKVGVENRSSLVAHLPR